MKPILIILFLLLGVAGMGQNDTIGYDTTDQMLFGDTVISWSMGISRYTEEDYISREMFFDHPDSVKIEIHGDTMKAIKNLLEAKDKVNRELEKTQREYYDMLTFSQSILQLQIGLISDIRNVYSPPKPKKNENYHRSSVKPSEY
jgi:hypothetical protein